MVNSIVSGKTGVLPACKPKLRRRVHLLVACAVFCFGLFLSGATSRGGAASVSYGAGGGSVQNQPRWPSGDVAATTQKISFVHVSDVHANYNPVRGGSSPVARLRGYFEQVRRENPYAIFTNAGDDYEKGSIAEEVSRGLATREIVQAMHYDVRTIGNHDFAWGIDELMAFSRDPSAIVLASNTKMTAADSRGRAAKPPGWQDYAVLRVGRVKIGFFGLVSKPWNEKDEQYDGEFYPGMEGVRSDFDFVKIARGIIAKHRGEVDLLVLVSHLGIEEDARLARETQGIDVILGGHSHTVMAEPLRVKGTTIIHAGARAENIGRFDLEYDLKKRCIRHGAFTLVPNREGETPVDEATGREVKKILHSYRTALYDDFTHLYADQNKGDMALLAARAAVETLEVDAAFVGLNTARKEWRRGGLTRQDIFDAFSVEREPAGTPGFTSLYRLKITGAELARIKAALPDSAYWGPVTPAPEAVYTVALQKAMALHQREYFGRGIGLSHPEPATELWDILVRFASERRAGRLALDEGAPAGRGYRLEAAYQGDGGGLPGRGSN
jgi:2',3'-cyclic-nucleotide 2'-phosphodiesterase (5'-nucleotidase family)